MKQCGFAIRPTPEVKNFFKPRPWEWILVKVYSVKGLEETRIIWVTLFFNVAFVKCVLRQTWERHCFNSSDNLCQLSANLFICLRTEGLGSIFSSALHLKMIRGARTQLSRSNLLNQEKWNFLVMKKPYMCMLCLQICLIFFKRKQKNMWKTSRRREVWN